MEGLVPSLPQLEALGNARKNLFGSTLKNQVTVVMQGLGWEGMSYSRWYEYQTQNSWEKERVKSEM